MNPHITTASAQLRSALKNLPNSKHMTGPITDTRRNIESAQKALDLYKKQQEIQGNSLMNGRENVSKLSGSNRGFETLNEPSKSTKVEGGQHGN